MKVPDLREIITELGEMLVIEQRLGADIEVLSESTTKQALVARQQMIIERLRAWVTQYEKYSR